MCINVEICKPIRNFWPFFQTRKLNWATIIISKGVARGGADGAAAPPWHVTAPPWWGSGAEVGQPVFWSTQKII